MVNVTKLNGLTLLHYDADGPRLGSDRDASDVMSEMFSVEADVVIIPVERFDPEFFNLRSGLAGGFFQKLQNYQKRLVVLGDISAQVASSAALRDFVGETNRIGNHLFVPDRDTLLARLWAIAVDLITGRTMLRPC